MVRKQQVGKGGNFESRPNPFTNKSTPNGLRADFTEIANIGKTIQVLLGAGCALIVGQTRDGGAVVLTILDGDNRHRTYCATYNELQEACDEIVKMYGDD